MDELNFQKNAGRDFAAGLARYTFRRILQSIPVLFGITILTFMILRLAPGEPAGIGTEFNANGANIAAQLREEYGLNKPIHEQYIDWIGKIVRLDFGLSMSRDRRPVLEKIGEALPISLMLNFIEFFFIFLVSIPLGILSAIYAQKLPDRILTFGSFALYSSPSFWTALLLMLFFGVELGWFPISGLPDNWRDPSLSLFAKFWAVLPYLALPLLTILFGSIAGMTRYVRQIMVEALKLDHVRTARAKGLPATQVLMQHAFRNGMLPIVTLLGLMLPGMIGGSVILEQVFSIPGMGRLFWQAVLARDYTLLMAILTIVSCITLAGTILADILYAVFNPRLRDSLSGS